MQRSLFVWPARLVGAYAALATAVVVYPFDGPPTHTTAALRLLSSPAALLGERLFGPYDFAEPDLQALAARGHALVDVTAGAQLVLRRPSPTHPAVAVLRVSGSPYLMGFQHGYLLRERVQRNVTVMMRRARGLLFHPAQLDAVYDRFEPFLSQADRDELQGLADGSGVGIRLLRQLHAVSEITEQSCSGYALLPGSTTDGRSYHVRILDWGTITGLEHNPAVLIYQGDGSGRAYVNFTWAGYVGALGGFNGKLAIGEIAGGDSTPEEPEIWEGLPFPFLFKEILREDATVESALARIESSHRTKKYAFVLSDPDSAAVLKAGPKSFHASMQGESRHEGTGKRAEYPGFPNLAFYGVRHRLLVDAFAADHRAWDLQRILESNKRFALAREGILDIEESMHVWVCSHTTLECWVANESPLHEGGAVDQPYVHLDLAEALEPSL